MPAAIPVLAALGFVLLSPQPFAGDSRVRPEVRRQVLHVPHDSAGPEQDRLHVQAAGLPHAAGRNGRDEARAEDLRAGQGHQVEPHELAGADHPGQLHGGQDQGRRHPHSNSSFNLDEAALFVAGSLPESNFSYFAQYELYEEGENRLEQAVIGYTGGPRQQQLLRQGRRDARAGGRGHAAAMFYNLFPEPALVLTNTSPINFSLDQHPVGVNVGYTWASTLLQADLRASPPKSPTG